VSAQLQLTVSLDVEQIDRLAARIALIVSEQLVGAMQRDAQPALAAPAPVAHLDERRGRVEDDTRPLRAVTPSTSGRGSAITPRQLQILESWRNRRALEDAVFSVVGNDVDLADLSKAEASRVIDALTPAEHRRPASGGRR